MKVKYIAKKKNSPKQNNLATGQVKIRELQGEYLVKKEFKINSTTQTIYFSDSRNMSELKDNSVHLMVTSPPYFNAKEYSKDYSGRDLGNIDDLDKWFEEINKVWQEVYRVIQPGRKIFINIMI